MVLEFFHWFIIGFLLLLPILYELSATFRYYAKFTLYYAFIMGISSVVCVYGLFRPGDVNNHWFIVWSMKHVRKLFGIEIEVRNRENLESDKPYILVMNHQSSLDCLGMFEIWPNRGCALIKSNLKYAGSFGLAGVLCGAVFIERFNHEKAMETMQRTIDKINRKNTNPSIGVRFDTYSVIGNWTSATLRRLGACYYGKCMMKIWPSRCVSLVKNELKFAGPFGLAALLCGTVFVDRLNQEKALQTMKKTAKTIVERNVKLLVFPEGTRNHEGGMMPFKKGCFHLAVQAQIPIVPVVFSSYSEFYNKQDKKFTSGKFIATCMPKISTKGLTSDDVAELTENVRKQMLEVYNQTSLESTQIKLASKVVNGNK